MRGQRTVSVGRQLTERSIAAGLMQQRGLPMVDEHAQGYERELQEAAANEAYNYREYSMRECVRAAAQAVGEHSHNFQDQLRAAVSGGALANIFTPAMNAQLMQSYTEAEDSTQGWVREVEVQDFKTNERVRLGKMSDLELLPRGGKAEHAAPGDVSESYRVWRYAKQFAIDDQDMIDDRLNALMGIPQAMGAAAARLRQDLVYFILLKNAALADGTALFHADHGNLTTAVLGAAGLQAGIATMAKQTEDGANLNIRPRFLVVPQDLSFDARVLLKSASRDHAGADGTFNPLRDMNIQVREDNRLGVAGVTDPETKESVVGTATNWFLSAAAANVPTIEVGYLAGTGRGPVLRSFQLSEGRWGIGWDINMDIGAKALDHRGLHKSTGTV